MDSISSSHSPAKPAPNPRLSATIEKALAEAVERLRFGVVQLTIHDGRVVQIDVTERQRFT